MSEPIGGNDDPLIIAGRAFRSRLMIGTGKFPSVRALREATLASGAEIVTVALRRVDLSVPGEGDLIAAIGVDNLLILQIGRAHV
jgi:thiazole synthase